MTFGGDELTGFAIEEPAASVRLLLPVDGELVMPTWDGNIFLLPDGARATIRTFTPRRFDSTSLQLDLEIVIHDSGAAADWVQQADIGDNAAISGPGRGYTIDPSATGFVLAGDETAIPAIAQLLEWLPRDRPAHALIEARHSGGRLAMPEHPHAEIDWLDRPTGADSGDTLVDAIVATTILPGASVWAAGEAGAMYRIRQHLFEERGLPRSAATVRGYWKRRD